MHSQLVVLGGGPGGYAAAFLAADHGMQVTIVEGESRLGGTCLLRGCIPSKALLHVAKVIKEVDELREDWGVDFQMPSIDIDKVRGRKEKVITNLSGGLAQLCERRNVTWVRGYGSFVDSTTLHVEGDHESIPEDGRITFEHCIIATGSLPTIPPSFRIESQRVMDSSGALDIHEVPGTLLVIGGGYIGLEMGTVYAQLGSKVSVVELMDGLLPGADRDLVRPLDKRLRKLFEDRIYLNTRVGSMGEVNDQVEVAFEGPGKFGTYRFDRVLVAVGRRPRTQGIGLENTQVRTDRRGFVQVDPQRRTADPHISAIGDVTGDPMLAHKATHEGRVAVEALLGEPAEFMPNAIPAVIFTDPEIAWAGLTIEEAKAANRPIEVASYPWQASGRAQALGIEDGLTKWIVDPDTGRVLGCGIVGSGAGELIAEAVLAIEMGCEVRDVTDTIHAHPTLSETLMNAGEVHFGTATEIFKPKRKPAASGA